MSNTEQIIKEVAWWENLNQDSDPNTLIIDYDYEAEEWLLQEVSQHEY